MTKRQQRKSRVQLQTLAWVMAATLLSGGLAAAQELVPPDVFDAGAALGALADATANESSATPPFVTLASPVSVDPQFGTANVTIPIEVPSGRNNMTPDVSLRYSSNAGNGLFGVGWSLGLGVVERRTDHGVPLDYATGLYSDAAGFQLSFRGGTVLLDTCADPPNCTAWAASAEETWLSPVFDRLNNRWQIRDLNGVTWTYGGARPARTGTDVGNAGETFAWYLTDAVDPSGNSIHVEYNDGGIANWNRFADLSRIDYGGNAVAGLPHIFHVEFVREGRSDLVATYRAGFPQIVDTRVSDIKVSVDTAPVNPVRTYHFTYEEEEYEDYARGWSLLRAVTLAGNDATTPAPPATVFFYSVMEQFTLYLGLHQNPNYLFFSPPAIPPGITSSQSTSNGTRGGSSTSTQMGSPTILMGSPTRAAWSCIATAVVKSSSRKPGYGLPSCAGAAATRGSRGAHDKFVR